MRSLTVSVLVAVLAQARHSIHALVDTLLYILVDDLLERALKASSFHHAALENSTHRKGGRPALLHRPKRGSRCLGAETARATEPAASGRRLSTECEPNSAGTASHPEHLAVFPGLPSPEAVSSTTTGNPSALSSYSLVLPVPTFDLYPSTSSRQIVLWRPQCQAIVVWDPNERSLTASRSVSEPVKNSDGGLVSVLNRCPLCSQTVSHDLAFVAQSYFRLLQTFYKRYRGSPNPSSSQDSKNWDDATSAASDMLMIEEKADQAASGNQVPRGMMNYGYYERFFREIKVLGQGGVGTVALCVHTLDNLELGEYAVKKIAAGDNRVWLRNMFREVKLIERFSHPNIVDYKHSWVEVYKMSDFHPTIPCLFILMQYCNAGSLEQRIWPHLGESEVERVKRLRRKLHEPPEERLSDADIYMFLFDILNGLAYLHSFGIVHRDVKPSNVLLHAEPDGRTTAMLSDFGTAEPCMKEKFKGRNPDLFDFPDERKHDGFTGTVSYTAPEVLSQDLYDEAADMWSLGILLFAMMYSAVPYDSPDPSVCKTMILEHTDLRSTIRPDWPRRPRELVDLMLELTSRDPEKRPTADDILSRPLVDQTRASSHAQNAFHPPAVGSSQRCQRERGVGDNTKRKRGLGDRPYFSTAVGSVHS